jgi:hypothetical protein
MGKRKGVYVGGLLLLLLAGCSGNAFLAGLVGLETTPTGDTVIVGSLEVVAADVQKKLEKFGLIVSRTEEAGVARLTCATRSGARFQLILMREQTYQGDEQVRFRLEWLEGRDDQLAVQVLAAVATR